MEKAVGRKAEEKSRAEAPRRREGLLVGLAAWITLGVEKKMGKGN